MELRDDKIRACAVCARVLDYVQPGPDSDAGDRWKHPMDGTRFAPDHFAVPVEVDQVKVEGKCDFCFAAHPQFEVPAADFFIPGLPGEASRGSWAACVDCARLLQTRNWDGLFTRAVAAHERQHILTMDRQAQRALRQLYRALRQNIVGDVRPLVWPPTRPPEHG